MADIIVDGNVRIYAVQAVVNLSAATVAELNAGIDLTPFIPPDGLSGWRLNSGKVDNSNIGSTFTTNRIGRAEAPDLAITFKAQSGVDTILSTFVEHYMTNIVIRRRGISKSTAWTAAQPYVLWPVEAGFRGDEDVAPNSLERFTIPFACVSDPILRGIVA